MDELEPIERKELLRIARSTLREYLAMGMIRSSPASTRYSTPEKTGRSSSSR